MTIIACYKLCKKGNLCVVVRVADKQVYFNFGFCDSSGWWLWGARIVITGKIFVTSILQSQFWIQINWTWLCVSHIRILLGLRWIDTYFILGDKKITVDLNSIRCRLDRSCIKLSNTIMCTLREQLLKMLILFEERRIL